MAPVSLFTNAHISLIAYLVGFGRFCSRAISLVRFGSLVIVSAAHVLSKADRAINKVHRLQKYALTMNVKFSCSMTMLAHVVNSIASKLTVL